MEKQAEKASTSAARKARERAEAQERARHGGLTGRVALDPSAPGGAEVDLLVPLAHIPEGGLVVREHLPGGWVNHLLGGKPGAESGWWAEEDAAIDLHLEAEHAGTLRLRGGADVTVVHSCGRCLEPVDFPLTLKLDLRLVEGEGEIFAGQDFELDPGGLGEVIGDDAGELLGDDEDLVTYQGDAVDLARLLREQVFLELPMHPVCDSTGARARGPCVFDPEGRAEAEKDRWADPRWEGLRALRDKLKS